MINRKEHGTPDSEYKQIAVTEGNEAQEDYYYNDVNAIPGIIYDYSVKGQVVCSDSLLESRETLTDVGFRTPTGDIYGRVTFESGQAVAGVKVAAEPTEGSGIKGKAYVFDGNDKLTVDNDTIMKNAAKAATLEAWVRPEAEGTIIEKPGMYKLAYNGGKMEFTAGTQTLKTDKKVDEYIKSAPFVHVSAVSADSLYIYMNDQLAAKAKRTSEVTGNDNKLVIGQGFKGCGSVVLLHLRLLGGQLILRHIILWHEAQHEPRSGGRSYDKFVRHADDGTARLLQLYGHRRFVSDTCAAVCRQRNHLYDCAYTRHTSV